MPNLPTLSIVLALGAGGLAGCGAANDNNGSSTKTTATNPTTAATASATAEAQEATSAGGKFVVRGGEWFLKAATTVKAGKVRVEFKNDGKVPHELIFLKTDAKGDSLKDSDGKVPEKNNVGEISDVAPVGEDEKTIDLKPGHYALICNLPDHYKLGMHTDLTVQ